MLPSMDRFKFLALAFSFLISLAACSSSQQEDEWAGEDSFFGDEDMAIVEGAFGCAFLGL